MLSDLNRVSAANAHYKTTHFDKQNTTALIALQDLRDIAWQYAIKYRWDPVLSKTHEEYLTMLNDIIKECEA